MQHKKLILVIQTTIFKISWMKNVKIKTPFQNDCYITASASGSLQWTSIAPITLILVKLSLNAAHFRVAVLGMKPCCPSHLMICLLPVSLEYRSKDELAGAIVYRNPYSDYFPHAVISLSRLRRRVDRSYDPCL